MGYIDETLGQNEVVQYRASFPWVLHATGWGTLILFALIALMAALNGYSWLGWIALAAGAVLFLLVMAPIWTQEIGVTNQRIIYKRGLFRRATSEMQLRSIEEVNLSQGLFGRLFDFGRLKIHGTGVNDIVLPALADPLGLRRAIQSSASSQARPSS
jgi:uncharacterized membrane protein YdbT with pleckstrin-like domain